MNEFIEKFGENKDAFKSYVKGLRIYNNELEKVLITMAETIQKYFIGKPITKTFTKILTTIIGENAVKFEITTSGYDSEKTISIEHLGVDVPYKYNYVYVLCTSIKFNHGNPSTKATCTIDNRFTEENVNAIVDIINHNRRVVAKYEDASKHLNQYIKKYEKAVDIYVRTMEGINPIFADISKAQTMSYCCNGVKNIELMAWENAFYPTVEQYVLD